MEKLIIKNFGPLRNTEIELKKINVFIGPQGNGKSAIAKIINAIRGNYGLPLGQVFWGDVKSTLENDFNLVNFFEKDTYINIETAEGNKIIQDINYGISQVAEDPPDSWNSIYIPAERTVVPLIAGSSFFFLRERIPIVKYITDFGVLFQNARINLKSQKFQLFDDVTYSVEGNADFITLNDGKKILLSESSNGIQTSLPLLFAINHAISVNYYQNKGRGTAISIEEPELSLFPTAQNELLKLIFEKVATLRNNYLNITTHSPYTLTTINNLIYAYQVGQKNEAVQDIIPKKLWLNPEDVGAWFVENGTVRSIIDEESGEIKAEEIDIVSNSLNQEYDKIMDIEVAQSK